MRLGAIDEIVQVSPAGELPLRLELSSSNARALTTVLLTLPFAIACLVPFGFVVAAVAESADAARVLVDQPLVSLKLALGLLLASVIVAGPIRTAVTRIGQHIEVDIRDGMVSVVETGVFGSRSWSEPLAAFRGVAHHIRASLSGARHEVVLVHSQTSRNVLLYVADRVQQSELDRFASQLGRPIVAAKEIYSAGTSAPVSAIKAA